MNPDLDDGKGNAVAVLMRLDWEGVTPAQYEALRKIVNWEGDQPPGGMSHVAAFDDAGIHVNDTWESAEQFQAFLDNRLMPGVQQVGVGGQPNVTITPAHAV